VSDGWSFGGSILTFAFPMLLFIGVAAALYVLYTKPVAVPGRRTSAVEHPVSYTAIPGAPAAGDVDGNGLPDRASGAATVADGGTAVPGVQE